MESKELIWVPKELKEAYEKAESEEEQKKIFFKAIEDRKLDIKNEIENLNDEMLLFKGIGIEYKTQLRSVYEEQSKQIDKIWDDFSSDGKILKQVKGIKKEFHLHGK